MVRKCGRMVRKCGRMVGLGGWGGVVALPDDALGEWNLDALAVEPGLDPGPHLAGDRCLPVRGGLEHDANHDTVGVPALDAPDLRLLDDVPLERGVLPEFLSRLSEQLA